jgi:hypothetical protein
LLGNGSLTNILWRCGFVEIDFRRNALSMSTESTDNFHGYAQATNIFHGYALDYLRRRTENYDSFVREFRRQFSSSVFGCEAKIRYQATASKPTLKFILCAVVTVTFRLCKPVRLIIIRSYDL